MFCSAHDAKTRRWLFGYLLLCVMPWCHMVKTSITTRPTVGDHKEHQLTMGMPSWSLRRKRRQQHHGLSRNDTTSSVRRPFVFTPDTAVHGDTFAPGSLNMTLLETFQRCNVDSVTRRYKKHEIKCTQTAYSPKYGLAYHLQAKAASSTLRGLFRDVLEGEEGRVCSPEHPFFPKSLPKERLQHLIHFTFFRDPLPRFVSGYAEFMSRFLRDRYDQKVPRRYAGFLRTLDRHLQNATLYKVKNAKEGGRKKGNNGKVRKSDVYWQLYGSTEGLQILAQVFSQFVQHYDGHKPFDKHLTLQVPRKVVFIGNSSGLQGYLDYAFYTEHGVHRQIEEVLFPQVLQQRRMYHHATVEMPNITDVRHGNSRKEKTKSMLDFVANSTKQKICQLTALDYCCLNYPLPEVCQDVVSCRWTNQAMPGSLPEQEGLLSIEAVSPYPPVA